MTLWIETPAKASHPALPEGSRCAWLGGTETLAEAQQLAERTVRVQALAWARIYDGGTRRYGSGDLVATYTPGRGWQGPAAERSMTA